MPIDEKTFTETYDRYAPKIFKFCYFRVSSREHAEDIAAQVFLRAWDHLVTKNDVVNMQAFLYRIAANLVIDFYRKNKENLEVSLDDVIQQIEIHDAHDVAEGVDVKRMIGEVQTKLQKIPDTYREVIIMKYVNDLSIKEIAEIMDTSENNISVRLHRALEKLHQLL